MAEGIMGAMMWFRLVATFMICVLSPHLAQAQPDTTAQADSTASQSVGDVPVIKMTAVKGPDGQIQLIIPDSLKNSLQIPTQEVSSSIEAMKGLPPYELSGDRAVARVGNDGKILEVFAPPRTEEEKAYLFNKIEPGDSLMTMAFWGSDLPTLDEVRLIAAQAINSAISVICATATKPRLMKSEVELAVALGLEGRLAFTLEYNPREDCP